MALWRRDLEGYDPRWAAIGAAGGLFVADRDEDAVALRDAVLGGRIRALEVHLSDSKALEGLPLEYLFVVTAGLDATPLNAMTNLRGLWLDSWVGDLEASRLPNLEWFGVTEVAPGQLDELFENGHQRLRLLSVGKYREPDLAALGSLPELADVAIIDSRSLASLRGVDALPRLCRLGLTMCPKLEGLDGIEAVSSLRSLVLESCNRVEDLAPLAGLPDLRVVQLEMRKPPPLDPLAGHPTLEFVWLIGGKRPVADIEALLGNPAMRMVNMNRASWMRAADGWLYFDDVYVMTPDQLRHREELIDVLNRRKYG